MRGLILFIMTNTQVWIGKIFQIDGFISHNEYIHTSSKIIDDRLPFNEDEKFVQNGFQGWHFLRSSKEDACIVCNLKSLISVCILILPYCKVANSNITLLDYRRTRNQSQPCGFESRIWDMEAENYKWSHLLVNI